MSRGEKSNFQRQGVILLDNLHQFLLLGRRKFCLPVTLLLSFTGFFKIMAYPGHSCYRYDWFLSISFYILGHRYAFLSLADVNRQKFCCKAWRYSLLRCLGASSFPLTIFAVTQCCSQMEDHLMKGNWLTKNWVSSIFFFIFHLLCLSENISVISCLS